MSTTRNYGYIVFECDDCGETLETSVKEFYLAPEDAKQAGWRISKTNGKWTHRCPDCDDTARSSKEDFEV